MVERSYKRGLVAERAVHTDQDALSQQPNNGPHNRAAKS
jgi:hypothetical protein